MSDLKSTMSGLPMPKVKKLITFLSAAAVLIACSKKQDAPQQALQSLPVMSVTVDTATTFKEYPAGVEGTDNIEIRPEISGKLQKLLVDEGAFVQKGQLLFVIDDHPFRERLNTARATLRAAEGALTTARLEVEKLGPLVKNNVVSSYQLKTAEAAKETAQGNVDHARAGVKSAQIELGYTQIKAPVSGYVGRLEKRQGSLVSANDPEPLALLSDIHDVHVYFSMSEIDFLKFKEQYKGITVEEKIKNLPAVRLILADRKVYQRPGHIDMVDGQFDQNTGAVALRATFPNPERTLRSGNTGKIRLGTLHDNVAIIPQAATLEMQDKIFVFTVGDGNTLAKQLIAVSGKNDENYYVKSGIKSGTKIITSGIEHVKEGEKIIPQEPSADLQAAATVKHN
ncbi:efflux RND transporter periplasmic adaptor subunit [Flavobacterium psychrotrophum]|uniref:efflux RND transporter periplasmic adaptor subunit n=1 Tax=Flavobacterium psychrotrophum TaxID=2294119 RepID=UPI001F08D056|nr:efflux RND transporter periplasmic adaptor subunit [Flavobacterium psychrotrophum]